MKNFSIVVSAPGKIHLLGEHAVVYGKPALLTTVGLRVTVTLSEAKGIYSSASPQNDKNRKTLNDKLKKTIESIVKRELNIKTIPPYQLSVSSQLPIGCGLGSSAALSAAYIAALLTFLDIKWDKPTVNDLAYEAEKAFHGNPSGGDNSTVVYGGLVWFTRTNFVQPLPFSIPHKLAKDFVLINTGQPRETTKEMVEIVKSKVKLPFGGPKSKVRKIFDEQEELVKRLLIALKGGDGNKLIQIIRAGEKNLEKLGVVSPFVKSIIRKIENSGGAAKICGAGGKTKATGILLAYHPDKKKLMEIIKSYNLPCFTTALGVDGLRQEQSLTI